MHCPTIAAALLAAMLSATATSPARAQTDAPRVGLREDELRPDEPLTIQLGPWPVQLTGGWEFTNERRRNFDTDSSTARDRRIRGHEVKLEARAKPTPSSEVFLQLDGFHETRRTQGTPGREVTHALGRGQAWVRFDQIAATPWSLQIGRIAITERRSWWWDEDLDAVRVRWADGAFEFDAAVGREVGRRSSDEDALPSDEGGIRRGMLQASWLPARRHRLDLFAYDERDGSGTPAEGSVFGDEDRTDPSDRRAHWHGLRASGEWRFDPVVRLAYWADAARLRGSERTTDFDEDDDGRFIAGPTTDARLRGSAWDAGLVLSARALPLRPFVAVSQARGSKGFRQTGLHENKARRGGAKRWQSYGELVQPELSNLSVRSIGAGLRLFDRSSIEVHTHRYRQLEASTTLHGSRLSSDPGGTDTDIGRGVDVMLALREWRGLSVVGRWSSFAPGAAFAAGERDRATGFELGLELDF